MYVCTGATEVWFLAIEKPEKQTWKIGRLAYFWGRHLHTDIIYHIIQKANYCQNILGVIGGGVGVVSDT